MSGSADVTSAVQKKYLTVKSADFNLNLTDDDYPYLDVEFPEPLHHVHEVALQSATIPNEFFNVRQGQNTLTIGWITQDTPATQSNAFTVEVAPGLYTLDKLCDKLNDAIKLVDQAELLWAPTANSGNGIKFERLDSSFATDFKVTQISSVEQKLLGGASQPTDTPDNRAYYAIVHVATPQAPFATSLAARLGFTRHDVFIVHESPRISINSGLKTWTNMPDTFNLANLDDMRLRGNTSVFEHHTNSASFTTGDNITASMLSGTESYDNIFLHCDLLSNSTLVTSQLDTSNQAITTIQRSDVLAVIPNNANIGSNILFVRPSEHYGGHATNQHRPITKMRLWLTDSVGKPFRQYEMPDYVAVLEFTVVEHVPDIMRQVAQLNQNKAFQSRHMPMMLG